MRRNPASPLLLFNPTRGLHAGTSGIVRFSKGEGRGEARTGARGRVKCIMWNGEWIGSAREGEESFDQAPLCAGKLGPFSFFFFLRGMGRGTPRIFIPGPKLLIRGEETNVPRFFFSLESRGLGLIFFFPPLGMNVNFNRSWVVINSIIFIVFVKLVFSYVMIKIIIISWILNETMIGTLMMNFKRRGLYFKKG